MSEYLKQANDFLNKTNSTLEIKFLKTDKYFKNDKEKRDIYEFTLTRGRRIYKGMFGNSLINSGIKLNGHVVMTTEAAIDKKLLNANDNTFKLVSLTRFGSVLGYTVLNREIELPKMPNAYDILSCLTKYDVGSFEDFCSEFGYDVDSRSAEKTYKAVIKEYEGLSRLYSDEELEEMSEIS
jgi:hypothetical protein